MADSMILTRGLAIPDPNFLHPIGDAWSYSEGGGFEASDFSVVTATVGCGRALKINVTDATTTTHILTSSLTPYGVCGAPWVSDYTERKPYLVYCMTAKTSGCTGNLNVLVNAKLFSYSASGGQIAETCQTSTLGPTDTTTWATVTELETGTAFHPDAYWHKLKLQFQDTTDDKGGYVLLSFVGVGIMYDGSGLTPVLTNDEIDGTFGPRVMKAVTQRQKWVTPQNTLNPKTRAYNMGARSQVLGLDFPALTTTEKEIVERAEMWNLAQPDDDADGTASLPANRGTRQPVLVALRRSEAKEAFYADMQLGGFSQAMDWYPDSGSRWQTQATFQERLF